MPLEATIICIDNSDYMRNGDYSPTRYEAQRDVVNLITNAKTSANRESTVALMKLADGPQTLATLTTDVGRILSGMHNVPLKGTIDLIKGLQVAMLCLKHRQNKNQRQRIVVFVGSPVNSDTKDLVKLAKKLKKNNVAVDIISFGDDGADNAEKLEAFIAANDSNDQSHLLTVPAGPYNLADMVVSSPLVLGEDAVAAGAAGGFGDAGMDDDLAMALRMSLEEERARNSAANGGEQTETAADTAAITAADDDADLAAALAMSMGQTGGDSAGSGVAATTDDAMDEGDDDDDLAAALAMSMQGKSDSAAATTDTNAEAAEDDEEEDDDDDDALAAALALSVQGAGTATDSMAVDNADTAGNDDNDDVAAYDEDAALAAALALSTQTPSAGSTDAAASDAKASSAADGNTASASDNADPATDPDFLQSVLATLPGVDPSDPQIQAILNQMKDGGDSNKK